MTLESPTRPPIKKGQIWFNPYNRMRILIWNKKGFKWRAKVLTDKHNVYNGTHTFRPRVLWDKFKLEP